MEFPASLVQGYRAFREGRLAREQDRYRALAEQGQTPEVMVIGCADSRAAPEAIFDAGPGELFVVRNVANLVPPYRPDSAHRAVSAALEFAVLGLNVKHIVVLGHARCGGVRAFAEKSAPLSPGDFIGRWMSLLEPAAARLGRREGPPDTTYLTRLEQAAILLSLENLMSFPSIRERVQTRRLGLHAAYFDISDGRLMVHDSESGAYRPVA